ncbi:hypothetical protein VB713_20330 [Anabaena cylindrica UHCC 0172]|uniref:hypothetical protein n=1 Tax=Anabaena cylindrica TaxID=1165 RepID=UPI002B2143FB|nr:hypothetical protein [Anabaena cylindrica]MEA5553290.1 hypothetical protein [Anabaena cylindrica UHCC 0172]
MVGVGGRGDRLFEISFKNMVGVQSVGIAAASSSAKILAIACGTGVANRIANRLCERRYLSEELFRTSNTLLYSW